MFIMIINNPHKNPALLLTFQKKKLYYNRISEAQIYQPHRIAAYIFLWGLLTLELNWMPIKRSFLILLIVTIILSIIPNHLSSHIFNSFSSFVTLPNIQPLNEPQLIQNIPKYTMTFHQFKSIYSKTYLNSQQEIYRSIVFYKNLHKINHNNQKLDRKFNLEINRFADLTPLEFSQTFTNLYQSNLFIQSYAEQLIRHQNDLHLINTYSIDQANPIGNNQDQIFSIKNHVLQNLQDKKLNVVKDNQEFNLVDEVIKNDIHSVKFQQAKNQELLNFFNSNITKKDPILPILIFPQISQARKEKDFQAQTNSISLNTMVSIPLKLTSTGDSSLMSSTSSNNVNKSSSGNFSTIVVDWTVHAGKIRYQGICGACYTFATSDVVGSLYAIYKFGFFVALSTQQVVDCSTNGLTYGCNGGFLEGSYAYMQIKGIQSDADYPYNSAISGLSDSCKKEGGSFKVASFRNIQQGNCKALVNQLNYGPVSIGIAGYRLQFYSNGIFNDCNSYVDHAVVLIGYKAGVGWKIKNSWGSQWGMNGFAWIADGNNCGICNMAVSARI